MGKRILVVEDDFDILRNLKELLESEGFETFTANNGHEGLNVLKSMTKLPNLIILDLMMPVMDGFAFRAEQKNDPQFGKVPVVVMTAAGHMEIARTDFDADDFIKKPPEVENFLKTIEKHILQD